jgi:hypothetical protein
MKKFIAILITILSFSQTAFAVAQGTTAFTDLPREHVNYVAINYLATEGIVKGYADGTFKPDNNVNRAEALKIILAGNKIEIPLAVETVSFTDMTVSDWFAPYVETAKLKGIVSGNPDGTFTAGRNVARADYLKMLLSVNGFKTENWTGEQLFTDVASDAWYAPYLNYAGQAGLILPDANNNLFPAKELTRGEVAEIFYLLAVIRNGSDTQFLLNQSEAEMAQVEIFVAANNPVNAKRAAELAVDMTQQAYKNMPDNNIVLGAAKLARAYDYLVNSYINALQKNNQAATDWANQAIAKATEAWEANNDLQALARHVKDRANEILNQLQTA